MWKLLRKHWGLVLMCIGLALVCGCIFGEGNGEPRTVAIDPCHPAVILADNVAALSDIATGPGGQAAVVTISSINPIAGVVAGGALSLVGFAAAAWRATKKALTSKQEALTGIARGAIAIADVVDSAIKPGGELRSGFEDRLRNVGFRPGSVLKIMDQFNSIWAAAKDDMALAKAEGAINPDVVRDDPKILIEA